MMCIIQISIDPDVDIGDDLELCTDTSRTELVEVFTDACLTLNDRTLGRFP